MWRWALGLSNGMTPDDGYRGLLFLVHLRVYTKEYTVREKIT